MPVGGIVYLGVDIGVCDAKVGGDDYIIFGIDGKFNMYSSHGFFDVSYYDELVGSFLDESLE